MAKIVIALSSSSVDSAVDPRFGRCPYFLIYDTESKEQEIVPNQSAQAFRGAGIAAAQFVVSQKAEAVIAGNFGPNSLFALQQAGIKLYSFNGSAKEALAAWENNNLTPFPTTTQTQGGWGRGMSRGAGRGGGFGQGRRGGRNNFPNL